jgi:hypothetical protein
MIPLELDLTSLPCPQLRHLELHGLHVQFEPTDDSPGVLSGCTALRVLVLERCKLRRAHEAFAAIAALPELQHLHYSVSNLDKLKCKVFPPFQQPLRLTHLSMQLSSYFSVETVSF